LIQLNDPSDHGQASAVLVGANCNIVFSDTVIQHNNGFVSSAELSTGGLYVYDSQITIERCVFYENDGAAGGAIRLDNSTATVESSVFDSNTASSSGVGAIDCCDGCDLTVWNCSFFNNYGYAGVVGVRTDAALNFRNSIVWQELPEAPDYQIYAFSGSDTSVTYSLVQGGFTGGGNIDADPLFVDSEHCDFHLQPASPCIDAANGYTAPEFDYDGNTRVDDPATANTGYGDPDFADMGAFEYQP
jgi:hypothetical protein